MTPLRQKKEWRLSLPGSSLFSIFSSVLHWFLSEIVLFVCSSTHIDTTPFSKIWVWFLYYTIFCPKFQSYYNKQPLFDSSPLSKNNNFLLIWLLDRITILFASQQTQTYFLINLLVFTVLFQWYWKWILSYTIL